MQHIYIFFLLHIIILTLFHFKRKTTYPLLPCLIFYFVNYCTQYLNKCFSECLTFQYFSFFIQFAFSSFQSNFSHHFRPSSSPTSSSKVLPNILGHSHLAFPQIHIMCFLYYLLDLFFLVIGFEPLLHCIFILSLSFPKDCELLEYKDGAFHSSLCCGQLPFT